MSHITGELFFILPFRAEESEALIMRKMSAAVLSLVLVFVLLIAPVYAAPPSSSGTNTITVTKIVTGDSNDTTVFTVNLIQNNTELASKTFAQGSPGSFTKLLEGTYTLTEVPTEGYTCTSANPVTVTITGKKGKYSVSFTNEKTAVDPDPPSIHYVALGDSIATGSTSRGTTTSYVYSFYNNLKLSYPNSTVTMSNLSVNGDDAGDLLSRLNSDSTYRNEVSKADFITITIGGNNILTAGENSFSSINNDVAETGTSDFESDFPQIIDLIRDQLNSTAQIKIMTLYNPYNTIAISGYTGDPALHSEAELYIYRINTRIRAEAAFDPETKVIEIHDYFKSTYADKGKMGSVTYFYPVSWLKFTRDPHPNQTGQTVIASKHQ